MFKHWKWTGLLCTALVAITLVSSGLIQGKGKPPKGDPPELPPVRYQIQFFEMPHQVTTGGFTNDFNNLGQVVGRYDFNGDRHAYLYDPGTAVAVDLNDIGVEGIPDGPFGPDGPYWYLA